MSKIPAVHSSPSNTGFLGERDDQTAATQRAETRAMSNDDITRYDEEDPLKDLEEAAELVEGSDGEEIPEEMTENTRSATTSTDTAISQLKLEDLVAKDLWDVFQQTGVEKTVEAAETIQTCLRVVKHKWRLLTTEAVDSKEILIEETDKILTLPHDKDSTAKQSSLSTIRLAVRDIIVNAVTTAEWRASATVESSGQIDGGDNSGSILNSILFGMAGVDKSLGLWAGQSEKRSGTKRSGAQAFGLDADNQGLETATENALKGKKRLRLSTEDPAASTLSSANVGMASANASADGGTELQDSAASAPKARKRRTGNRSVPWSAEEDLKLRKLRASDEWHEWSKSQRAEELNKWLANNGKSHTRSPDAVEQRCDRWIKDPSTDPDPTGKSLQRYNDWKARKLAAGTTPGSHGQSASNEDPSNTSSLQHTAATTGQGTVDESPGDTEEVVGAEKTLMPGKLDEEEFTKIVKRSMDPILDKMATK